MKTQAEIAGHQNGRPYNRILKIRPMAPYLLFSAVRSCPRKSNIYLKTKQVIRDKKLIVGPTNRLGNLSKMSILIILSTILPVTRNYQIFNVEIIDGGGF